MSLSCDAVAEEGPGRDEMEVETVEHAETGVEVSH